MEFEQSVFTVAIPLAYDPADFAALVRGQKPDARNPEPDPAPPFRPSPVSRSFQLEGSPVMRTGKDTLFARYELTQSQRSEIGIHHNLNCTYLLTRGNIRFQIKQVRLWAFRWGTAFLTLNIDRNGLSDKEILDLTAQLCTIRSRTPISYRLAAGKDCAQTRTFTMRDLIEKFLALQANMKFQPYPNETLQRAYCLFCGIGDLSQTEEHDYFLEMLRMQRRSCMRSFTGVEAEHVYRPFNHLHWVAGERVLAVIGDLSQGDEENNRFLRSNGGLRKTVLRNYLLLYLYCISLNLYAGRMMRECEEVHSGASEKNVQKLMHHLITLSRIPAKGFSQEAHINILFERHLCEHTWKLRDRIEVLRKEYLPALIRNMPCEIFISYRRKGGFYPARLLYTLLEQRQKKAFLDMESLGTGPFDEHIYEVLDRCSVVLVVLTKDCLTRCTDAEDWMRKELAKALERKKQGQLVIIPVMIDDFEFPKNLPEEIDISRENAVRFTPQSFRGDFEMLCRFLSEQGKAEVL